MRRDNKLEKTPKEIEVAFLDGDSRAWNYYEALPDKSVVNRYILLGALIQYSKWTHLLEHYLLEWGAVKNKYVENNTAARSNGHSADVKAQGSDKKFDVNFRYHDKRTALHFANSEAVPILIAYGADVNARDVADQTPLMRVADKPTVKGLKITKILLENGAQVNATDQDAKNQKGKTALTFQLKILQSLTEASRPIAYQCCVEIIECLLKYGADVEVDFFEEISDPVVIKRLRAGLLLTAMNRGEDYLKTLSENGSLDFKDEGFIADFITIQDETVLSRAASNIFSLQIVLPLFNYGLRSAKITFQDRINTCLYLAVVNNYPNSIRALLKLGANMNDVIDSQKNTILMFAAKNDSLLTLLSSSLKLREIVDTKAAAHLREVISPDLKACNALNQTPLTFAVAERRSENVAQLIQLGAGANVADVYIAVCNRDISTIDALLECETFIFDAKFKNKIWSLAEIDKNIPYNRYPERHRKIIQRLFASKIMHQEAFQYKLDAWLLAAVSHDNVMEIGYLLKQGADPYKVVDSNGQTILMRAASRNCLLSLLPFPSSDNKKFEVAKNKVEVVAQDIDDKASGIVSKFNGGVASQKVVPSQPDLKLEMKNQSGETLLLIATKAGRLKHVLRLILLGANADIADNEGYTPLYRALEQGFIDVAHTLCECQDLDVTTVPKSSELSYTQLVWRSMQSLSHLDREQMVPIRKSLEILVLKLVARGAIPCEEFLHYQLLGMIDQLQNEANPDAKTAAQKLQPIYKQIFNNYFYGVLWIGSLPLHYFLARAPKFKVHEIKEYMLINLLTIAPYTQLKGLDPKVRAAALKDSRIVESLKKYEKCADIVDLALYLNRRCAEADNNDCKVQLSVFSKLRELANKQSLNNNELHAEIDAQINKIASFFGNECESILKGIKILISREDGALRFKRHWNNFERFRVAFPKHFKNLMTRVNWQSTATAANPKLDAKASPVALMQGVSGTLLNATAAFAAASSTAAAGAGASAASDSKPAAKTTGPTNGPTPP